MMIKERCNAIGIVMPLASPRGGAEILLQNLLSCQTLSYRYVFVFFEDGPLVEQARLSGHQAEVFPASRLRNPGNYIKTVASLRSWMKRNKPCAVLSWMAKAHLYVSAASAFLDIRTLWFQHGVPHKGERMDHYITAMPADAVLCCSDTSRQAQSRVLPKRKLFVCYPGIDAPKMTLSLTEARRQLGLVEDRPLISMVARLERWKGVHIFIEAAAEVLTRYPEARFFVVGGPHPFDAFYTEELTQQIADRGVGYKVTLLGQRPRDETRLWQISSDIIVQPTTGVEPFGIAVVEAMGLGKIVVASGVGGPTEIIEDGLSGILVPPGDARGLSATLIKVLASPEEIRKTMAAEAVRRSATFSIENFGRRLEEIIAEIVDSPSS